MSRPKGSKNKEYPEVSESIEKEPIERAPYIIVKADSYIALEAYVNQNIDDGYEPTGGVSVTTYMGANGQEFLCFQAMVKK